MGRHHAASGALAGVVLGLVAHQPAATTLALGACCAGAALLADLDEPGSTVSRSAEPLSGAISYLTATLAGGHREATHSVLAAGLAAGGTAALGLVAIAPGAPCSVIPLGLTIALAARALPPKMLRVGRAMALLVGAAAAWAITRWVGLGWWVVAAVALGWLVHLIGDVLTEGGVPLLWPWRRRFAAPVLGTTGSGREALLGALLLVAVVVAALGPAWVVVSEVRG